MLYSIDRIKFHYTVESFDSIS